MANRGSLVETDADQSTAAGIVDQLAGSRIAQTESGSVDRRKAFGLAPPQTSVVFQLANGSKHTILIGNQDFTGEFAYTIVDNAQSVSLLPGVAGNQRREVARRFARPGDPPSRQRAGHFIRPEVIPRGIPAASKDKDAVEVCRTPQARSLARTPWTQLLQAVANSKMVSQSRARGPTNWRGTDWRLPQ